jgi:hypothetical protein
VRTLAVRELSPVDKIALGKRYNVGSWLRPAYLAVCEREEPITDAEGERPGLADVLKISRAQQALCVPARLRESANERATVLDDVFSGQATVTLRSIASISSLDHTDDPLWKHQTASSKSELLVHAPVPSTVRERLKTALELLDNGGSR